MTVVDASVTAKWFLPELDSCEAERLLEGPETMIAPDLIRIEVAAAISRRFRLGDLDAAEAGELCEEWLKAIAEGVVSTVPSALDIADAVRLSLAIRHALQDCLYLALAMRLDAELVTADSTFATRAGTAHHAVRLLAQGIRE